MRAAQVGLVVTVIPTSIAALFFGGSGWRSPAAKIRDHFDYLTIDPAGVNAFVRDMRLHRGWAATYLAWPPDAYTTYLLSTDFFRREAGSVDPIHYVGFYDPYVTPCNNPCARFDA